MGHPNLNRASGPDRGQRHHVSSTKGKYSGTHTTNRQRQKKGRIHEKTLSQVISIYTICGCCSEEGEFLQCLASQSVPEPFTHTHTSIVSKCVFSQARKHATKQIQSVKSATGATCDISVVVGRQTDVGPSAGQLECGKNDTMDLYFRHQPCCQLCGGITLFGRRQH